MRKDAAVFAGFGAMQLGAAHHCWFGRLATLPVTVIGFGPLFSITIFEPGSMAQVPGFLIQLWSGSSHV